jgi:protein TonB
MEAARLLVAAVPAWLVTFGLFYLMQALIDVEWTPASDSIGEGCIDIVKLMLPPKPKPPTRRTPIDRHPPPPPTTPTLPTDPISGADPTVGFAIPRGPAGEPAESGQGRDPQRFMAEGEAIRLVGVEPQYPLRALKQRREGRVLVEFTIDRAGTVRDARVIAADPAGLFEEAALQAVSQWRYSPKVVHGRAVEQRGIRTSIAFRLDQARS